MSNKDLWIDKFIANVNDFERPIEWISEGEKFLEMKNVKSEFIL